MEDSVSRGGILVDDMGLGKIILILVFIYEWKSFS